MRRFSLAGPFAALIVAGCVPSVAPPPAPAPAPAPLPAPTPAPAPALTGDWRDWPLTPGDWQYRPSPTGGTSSFGLAGATPTVTLTCNRAARRVTLDRAGTSASRQMTITTTSQTTTRASNADGHGGTAASFAATDNLLDAIGYSRGRFIIQQDGLPTLVVPTWPEIERVTEDCRG